MNPEEKYNSDIKKRLKECNAIQLNVYLSRSQGDLFVAIEGNFLEMNDFGIDAEKFSQIGDVIDNICQKIIMNK